MALTAEQKLEIIEAVLKDIGFPIQYCKELTYICVLALLDKKPRDGLIKGKTCLHDGARITDILNKFANGDLNKNYAENTRETIRKDSLKRLVDFGLVDVNKDDPMRSTNSGNTNYTIVPAFERLINSYGTEEYNHLKRDFENELEVHRRALIERLRNANVIIEVPNKEEVLVLSPGNHNIIEKFIVEEIMKLESEEPHLLYLGDTKNKLKYVDYKLAEEIGIIIDPHEKLPDVIGYDKKNEIILVYEAVASSGPVDELRLKEILDIFNDSPYSLKISTVFLSELVYRKYCNNIAPKTSVYIIESMMRIFYDKFEVNEEEDSN